MGLTQARRGQVRRPPRRIVPTPSGARLGNLLYFWLHAHRESQQGRRTAILANDHASPYLRIFPALRELTCRPGDVRARDVVLNMPPLHFQRFGLDFDRVMLEDFVFSRLTSTTFAEVLAGPLFQDGLPSVTINIRRGDYYSVGRYRDDYGFDSTHFLACALRRVAGSRRSLELAVVSDDPGWCRSNLAPVLSKFGPVEYTGGQPFVDLARLAVSGCLVLSNSTFSYWGGYLSNALGYSEPSSVVAPDFHMRSVEAGAAWQLDPQWLALPIDRTQKGEITA